MGHWDKWDKWDKWDNFVKSFPLFSLFSCHLLEVHISQISCHLEECFDSDSFLVSFHAVVAESVAFPCVVVGVPA